MPSQTPQEQLDYLLESVWHPTNSGVILRDVYAAAGDYANQVAITLYRVRNPPLGEIDNQDELLAAMALAEQVNQAVIAMSTKEGLVLSDAQSQGMIDLLAQVGEWPDAVRDAVKALGGSYVPRWQVMGIQDEPTLAGIEARQALNAIIDRANAAVSEASSAYDSEATAAEITAAGEAAWGQMG